MEDSAFWLLWAVLTLNVSAGIGVLYISSPMLQEVFGGAAWLDIGFDSLNADQKTQIAAIAAGFTGLLSLCNIFGRLGWPACRIGWGASHVLPVLPARLLSLPLAPIAAHAGMSLFRAAFCVI